MFRPPDATGNGGVRTEPQRPVHAAEAAFSAAAGPYARAHTEAVPTPGRRQPKNRPKRTMSLPTGRRKGTCSLWLKRNWVLLSLIALALAAAALSVLFYPVHKSMLRRFSAHG